MRAQYIEVFHANAIAFPADIQQVHLELTCDYALSIGAQSYSSAGGFGVIGIATGAGCPWTVGALPPGVMITSAANGTGSGTVTFQVGANSGGDLSNSFTIAEKTFTIEQEAASLPGLTFVGSMPHLAAEENWTTAFTLVKKSNGPATARLSLFGDPLVRSAYHWHFRNNLRRKGPCWRLRSTRRLPPMHRWWWTRLGLRLRPCWRARRNWLPRARSMGLRFSI